MLLRTPQASSIMSPRADYSAWGPSPRGPPNWRADTLGPPPCSLAPPPGCNCNGGGRRICALPGCNSHRSPQPPCRRLPRRITRPPRSSSSSRRRSSPSHPWTRRRRATAPTSASASPTPPSPRHPTHLRVGSLMPHPHIFSASFVLIVASSLSPDFLGF